MIAAESGGGGMEVRATSRTATYPVLLSRLREKIRRRMTIVILFFAVGCSDDVTFQYAEEERAGDRRQRTASLRFRTASNKIRQSSFIACNSPSSAQPCSAWFSPDSSVFLTVPNRVLLSRHACATESAVQSAA